MNTIRVGTLVRALLQLGLSPGGILLVHSSFLNVQKV